MRYTFSTMLSAFTLICLVCLLSFPSIMIMVTYPFSHKAALFWSNYITSYCDRLFFAILRYYRGFRLLADRGSKEQLPEQFLILSNHQSLFDICVYLRYFCDKKVRFVAKDSLVKVPMVGKMLKSQHHCMIPRSGGARLAMNSLRRFGEEVFADKEKLPLIFPEGTRSKDGRLGKFYSAGFRRLEETVRLPVVACALDGGWRLSNLTRIFASLKCGTYRVKVLKVFDVPRTKEEEQAVLDESHALIEAQLERWRSLPADSLEV